MCFATITSQNVCEEQTKMRSFAGFLVVLVTSLGIDCKCGLSYSHKRRLSVHKNGMHIYGGQNAFPGDFPWMRLIAGGKWSESYDSRIRNKLMRARHFSKWVKLRAVYGTLQWAQEEAEKQKFSLSDVIKHEGYEDNIMLNDIALIKLPGPIKYSADVGDVNGRRTSIGPVCLPRKSDIFRGMASVAGWGRSEKGHESILQFVNVKVLNASDCAAYTKRGEYKAVLLGDVETKICAGYEIGKKDSCSGDSGGPLVSKNGEQAVLIGIVSFGAGCAQAGFPGVYTKVAAYRNWIVEKTQLKFSLH